ncbi:hypothetical protein [Mesorhizobium huakuii]|uniref:Uncharacterized protein n=1 Tax=Mesorhizobium huakuii TaxID=28104 RepID=A0A7G6SSB6_9HYPH|nr:hypothetical protein [Mesorhizobium huakuii]QND57398.1 hypothetical protein HB778_12810 [Mesorhizobium huakuii]
MIDAVGIGLIGGFCVGVLCGRSAWVARKDKAELEQPSTYELKRNVEEAEGRYLEVLRREMANILMVSNPDTMLTAYDKAWRYQREIVAADPERRNADLHSITQKFKYYREFELLGTRHFVPYEAAMFSFSEDEVADRYVEISKMLILRRTIFGGEKTNQVFDDQEYEVLSKSVRAQKDRAFRAKIEHAMARFYAFSSGYDQSPGATNAPRPEFDMGDVSVFRLRSASFTPENENGIVFKLTGEYAVYTTFHDHERCRTYQSYYRSNASFGERQALEMR